MGIDWIKIEQNQAENWYQMLIFEFLMSFIVATKIQTWSIFWIIRKSQIKEEIQGLVLNDTSLLFLVSRIKQDWSQSLDYCYLKKISYGPNQKLRYLTQPSITPIILFNFKIHKAYPNFNMYKPNISHSWREKSYRVLNNFPSFSNWP